MKEIYIASRRVNLDPAWLIGEGGEAEIYDLSSYAPDTALKLWKTASHPDFAGTTDEAKRNREGAVKRIAEYGEKLTHFPHGLPSRVIAPTAPVTSRGKDVVGYIMPFVRGADVLREYAQRGFRKKSGIDGNAAVAVLSDLHATVQGVHQAGVVIGDFNNLNVMVKQGQAFLIDADSMQFGGYMTRSFTTRFVDPLICNPSLNSLVQSAPHSVDTDWYAFALMVFESMLFVHPYGGVYEPKRPQDQVGLDLRPLRRISVFNKDVLYPVKGVPLRFLPDEALHYYQALLEKDARGIFPRKLIENLRWTRCTSCGTEHARTTCPECAQPIPQRLVKVSVRGRVTSERMFNSSGVILESTLQHGELKHLTWENGQLQREDGGVVLKTGLSREMKFRILGRKTVVALGGNLAVLDPQNPTPERYQVDTFRGARPIFDTNEDHLYWLSEGRLLRNDTLGPRFIGNVLKGQTLIWVGRKFGFGLSRAGGYQSAFVFDAKSTGINDRVILPQLKGDLVGARAYFGDTRCWFFAATSEQGKIRHHCFLLDAQGKVLAQADGEEGDGTWLGSLGAKVALTLTSDPSGTGSQQTVHALFSVSERGLVRVEERGAALVQTADFPDTRDFVDTDSGLIVGSRGLLATSTQSVQLLTIRRQ